MPSSHSRIRTLLLAVVSVFFLGACTSRVGGADASSGGGSGGGVGSDSGSAEDAGWDGGTADGGADSGTDAGFDAGSCPSVCTDCTAGVCIMGGCPDAGCVCPQGMPCSVNSSSGGGVDCSRATDCTVRCETSGACSAVVCGSGHCQVSCLAIPSCLGPIDCSRAHSCDISCTQDACRGPISCGGASCKINCSTLFNGCLGTDPIVCDAGSCEIDCSQGCFGRPRIECGAGSCKVDSYFCNNMCPVVDCSRSCGCQVIDHGPKPASPSCPSSCDGGCTGLDASACWACP